MKLLLLLILPSIAVAQLPPEDPFEAARRAREVARQKSFDRGQRGALGAEKEREEMGRLDTAPPQAPIAKDTGRPVDITAPAAHVYNRVMETQRFFKHYGDPDLRNANDTFIDSESMRLRCIEEAHTWYPKLKQPDSAFALRHGIITAWVEARKPPLWRDSRRYLLIAHMVSLELYGKLHGDSMKIGQTPFIHRKGQMPPAFIVRNNFIIEVRSGIAHLPDGIKGTATVDPQGRGDFIAWLDAEGQHRLFFPKEPAGLVVLYGSYQCQYHREKRLNEDYVLRVSKSH